VQFPEKKLLEIKSLAGLVQKWTCTASTYFNDYYWYNASRGRTTVEILPTHWKISQLPTTPSVVVTWGIVGGAVSKPSQSIKKYGSTEGRTTGA